MQKKLQHHDVHRRKTKEIKHKNKIPKNPKRGTHLDHVNTTLHTEYLEECRGESSSVETITSRPRTLHECAIHIEGDQHSPRHRSLARSLADDDDESKGSKAQSAGSSNQRMRSRSIHPSIHPLNHPSIHIRILTSVGHNVNRGLVTQLIFPSNF